MIMKIWNTAQRTTVYLAGQELDGGSIYTSNYQAWLPDLLCITNK